MLAEFKILGCRREQGNLLSGPRADGFDPAVLVLPVGRPNDRSTVRRLALRRPRSLVNRRRAASLHAAGASFHIVDATGRHTIAAAALALIKSRISCAHHPFCQLAAGTGNLIEGANPETRRD
jgi:hypothetical protein